MEKQKQQRGGLPGAKANKLKFKNENNSDNFGYYVNWY